MHGKNTVALLALWSILAHGQDSEPAQTAGATLPEEVIITGSREVYRLREAMLAAEVRAYDIFNRLNDERRFDINCSSHEPTGSRIRQQVCLPAFQLEAFQQHATQYVESTRQALGQGGANFTIQHQPQEALIASQQEDFRRKLKQVAETHPEFLDALIEYSELQTRYGTATGLAP